MAHTNLTLCDRRNRHMPQHVRRCWPFAIAAMASLAACGQEDPRSTSTKHATADHDPLVASAAVLSRPRGTLPPGVKRMQAAEVQAAKSDVQRQVGGVTRGDFLVSGRQRYEGFFLASQRIVFGRDAVLVFTRHAIEARGGKIFVLARSIISRDPQHPGKIVWEETPIPPQPDAGQAGPGQDRGTSVDVSGGGGQAGGAGYSGASGQAGPNLTILSTKVDGTLLVSLSGQQGGAGGTGQAGGQGGQGGRGHDGSQNALNCNRGAGDGGSGGPGGPGGPGGSGGAGGNGGTLTLIGPQDNLPLLSREIRVDLAGGPGGQPGPGGRGGRGGDGGGGGSKSLPFCHTDGNTGPQGPAGSNGPSGSAGAAGASGDFFVGGLDAADIDRQLHS